MRQAAFAATFAVCSALSSACHDATGPGRNAPFRMTLRYLDEAPPSLRQAFDSAAAAWGRALYGGLAAIPVDTTAAACGLPAVRIHEDVADILVLVNAGTIDGPGGTWGLAWVCLAREGDPASALVGRIKIDTADIARMQALDRLEDLLFHEAGHTIGFNPIAFSSHQCLAEPFYEASDLPAPPMDTHFVCRNALDRFNAAGGATYTASQKVPLENCSGRPGCGGSQANWHWRESVFGAEVMTPYLDIGSRIVLSAVTLGALEDIGHRVNYAAAESWTLPAAAPSPGPRIDLGRDLVITDVPVPVLDRRGRVIGALHLR